METLVLDATWQAIDRVSWERAMTLAVGGRVEVVEEYEDREIRTVSVVFRMPSVVRYVAGRRRQTKRSSRFSRHNVYLRDRGRCQYCRQAVPRHKATFDHVVPRVQGGGADWNNIVMACVQCNHRKGGRTPKEARMRLHTVPRQPDWLPDAFRLTVSRERDMPPSWAAYLPQIEYWYTALQKELGESV
ncbi:MAG: 5-methylcytosine-specific restriction endonuclease McrA [Bradymonadia bacterium]|jgi:5-methylcytosine-specific restriction endonuclease McrA